MPFAPHALLCALLRGEAPPWPRDDDAATVDAFLRAARHHGVSPLVDARLRQGEAAASLADVANATGGRDTTPDPSSTPCGSWPESIRRACREDALVGAIDEVVQRAELERVLDELARHGIAPLLLKGGALAYTHYDAPALRPRADVDLLVAPSRQDAARRILRELGYRRVSGPAGRFVGYQAEMTRVGAHGRSWTIDLHWRLSNAQSFAWLYSFDELVDASRPIAALGVHARGLGDAHALTVALLHRAANNVFVAAEFGDRLIWLHDIRVLADAMDDAGRADFVRGVEDRRVAAIALDGLRRCAQCLASPHAGALIAALERSPAAAAGAELLRAGRWRREWLELRALPTLHTRLAYLAGRALPEADYLRERFPEARESALALLHARRWLGGIAARKR